VGNPWVRFPKIDLNRFIRTRRIPVSSLAIGISVTGFWDPGKHLVVYFIVRFRSENFNFYIYFYIFLLVVALSICIRIRNLQSKS
jgi:hypothetical protein